MAISCQGKRLRPRHRRPQHPERQRPSDPRLRGIQVSWNFFPYTTSHFLKELDLNVVIKTRAQLKARDT